ncbi:MAG: calcium-binding protein [Hydrococcus sp. RM1_1_31]|nr:calcium-binding protein [Hydrococcus sp. RM1_1_31]
MANYLGTNGNDGWQIENSTSINFYRALGGNDTIYGSNGSDRLFGNGGKDNLFGNDGSDTLIGGVGSDRLSGGQGNDSLLGSSSYGVNKAPEIDTLAGGAGADVFWLTATNEGGNYYLYNRFGDRDLAMITDYNLAEDRIVLPGQKNDYVLDNFGADIVIGLDSNQNFYFDSSDEAIAIVTSNSFTLEQAVFVRQTV